MINLRHFEHNIGKANENDLVRCYEKLLYTRYVSQERMLTFNILQIYQLTYTWKHSQWTIDSSLKP